MDMGVFRGLVTAILLMAFIGLVIWAWSSRRKRDFDQAARLAVDDEPPSASLRKPNGESS